MKAELKTHVETIRKAMETMTNDERLELLSEIADDYCCECGRKEDGRRCQCWNDE